MKRTYNNVTIPSLHFIEVKYMGPTNTTGSRIKLTSLYFPNDSVTFPLNYSKNNIISQAEDILLTAGFKIKADGTNKLKGVEIIGVTEFEKIKGIKKYIAGLKLMEEGNKRGPSDWKYYNKSESYERSYLPKRKTTVKRYRK
jgi:hypothetical protein